MNRNLRRFLVQSVILALAAANASAADWPMWRYDAGRTAASPEQLPASLQLLWTREFSPRKQTWDDPLNLDLMNYDRIFEPVIAGGRVFVGFNDRDKLVAYDAETGAELWTHHAAGPVRLAPAVWQDHVYFASDDGHLYCVRASDGRLKWKFRGGVDSRQNLGNQRLISAWPMRGGPVIRDGKVYVATSIWPFMGVFIHALDAATGDVVWVNDETGSQYIKLVKGTPSFGGIAPQGALVATNDLLLVPGGRTVPAAFDRRTGEMLYYGVENGGKGNGGSFVAATEQSWFVHTREKGTREFSLKSGEKSEFVANEPVLAERRIFSAEVVDGRAVVRACDSKSKEVLWEIESDGRGDLILAGNTLYAAGMASAPDASGNASATQTRVAAIRVPDGAEPPAVLWTMPVLGQVERLAAAGGKLFAVTLDGRLHAFGAGSANAPKLLKENFQAMEPRSEVAGRATELLKTGPAEGYALWLGAGDQSLIEALAARSPFVELAVFEEKTSMVDSLRRRLDAAGLGGRVTVHETDWSAFSPPPYVANMLFVAPESTRAALDREGLAARLYESVRPYGGVLYLLAAANEIPDVRRRVNELGLQRAEVSVTSQGVVVRRVGSLPGAGEWTHKYGDIANSIKSNDVRVKLPLGILWFGGFSNDDILPRHGHGPPQQVVGGRSFIQGINLLTAHDVYTGRVLWKREFKNLGMEEVFFDETYKETPLDIAYNQVHIPGSNGRGTNYVVTEDRIYLIERDACHVLDPATGLTLSEIRLPQDDPQQPRDWGYIGVYRDVLIGGLGFADYRARHQFPAEAPNSNANRNRVGFGIKSLDRAASLGLVGFDRKTGRQLWKVEARHSFWHNGIVAGNGLIYALDKNPKPIEDFLIRRGKSNPSTYRIVAFDALTGQVTWETQDKVFGTWLSYSEERDVLLQAGAAASDRLAAEVGQGMAVHRGKDGAVIWRKDDLKYSGPCVLHHDLIITNADQYAESAGAFHLSDGSPKMVTNPLTGELVPWKITRAKGCNTILASENLLTYRSETAGFYDLLTDSGTGHFGGFRSGCTSNLIIADGVLNAPDYTRTCSCAYQNQTSLALVHMPDIDAWSVSNTALMKPSDGPLRKLGVNLGAPGNRRDALGLLWLEFPAKTGDVPNLGLELSGDVKYFADPAASMRGAPLPFVTASGVEGITRIRLGLRAASKHSLKEGVPIDNSDDDAEEAEDGAVSLNSNALELVQSPETSQAIGLRFNEIGLRQGAEIRSAALQFACRLASDEPTELIIQAQASGNADRFTDRPKDISQRPLTSSQIRWKPAAWEKAGEAGPAQRSPDLTPLVREVISRPDWKPGNSIVFVIRGTGKRVATAFLGRETLTAKLVVDAEVAAGAAGKLEATAPYRVRLHFGCPPSVAGSRRVFDVAVPGQTVIENVTLGGAVGESKVHTIDRVLLGEALELRFTAKEGKPLLCGIELHRLDD